MTINLTVRVSRTALLKLVREHRERHVTTYEAALEGWRRQVIRDLQGAIKTLRADGDHPLLFTRRPPTSHAADYDAVASMLELSADDVVEVSAGDYRQVALDEWDWTRDWTSTVSSYTSAG